MSEGQLNLLPTTPLLIDGCSVTPVSTVRDLGIYIDSDLSKRLQVKWLSTRSCGALPCYEGYVRFVDM